MDGRRQMVRAQYEDIIRTANPLPARYLHVRGVVVDVDPLSDYLRTCAFRLDNIFRSGKTYLGVAMHILEWQYIFRSGNTYFGVAMQISERQYIFLSRNTYFRAGLQNS